MIAKSKVALVLREQINKLRRIRWIYAAFPDFLEFGVSLPFAALKSSYIFGNFDKFVDCLTFYFYYLCFAVKLPFVGFLAVPWLFGAFSAKISKKKYGKLWKHYIEKLRKISTKFKEILINLLQFPINVQFKRLNFHFFHFFASSFLAAHYHTYYFAQFVVLKRRN